MNGGEPERVTPAAPGDSQSGQPTLAELEQALAEAQARAGTLRDQYMRAVAELENVRKRAQRDVENASRYGLEKFAVELLPVLDSLLGAVSTAASADARSLLAGQEATLKLLVKAFERLNIRQIVPTGEPFDPERHEAVMAQDSTTAEPNAVLQVVQPGFELGGR